MERVVIPPRIIPDLQTQVPENSHSHFSADDLPLATNGSIGLRSERVDGGFLQMNVSVKKEWRDELFSGLW